MKRLSACLFFIFILGAAYACAQDTPKEESYPPAAEIIPFGTHANISINYAGAITFDPGSVSEYFREVSGETLSTQNPSALSVGIDGYLPLSTDLFTGLGAFMIFPLSPVKGLKDDTTTRQEMKLYPMMAQIRVPFSKAFSGEFSSYAAAALYIGWATGVYSDTGASISRDIVISPGIGWGVDAGVNYFPFGIIGFNLEGTYRNLTVPLPYRDSYSASGTSYFTLADSGMAALDLVGFGLKIGIAVKLSAKNKEDF